MTTAKRWIATVVAASLTYVGSAQAAQSVLIGTEQVAAAQGVVSVDAQAQQQRAQVLAHLDRADVQAGLVERGVSADQVRERVAALTDVEVQQLAHTLDTAPAGADGGGILGVIVFIFVLLLVTDILGLTKVFPFTRSVR